VLDGARDPVYLGGDCGLYSENFELGPGWRAGNVGANKRGPIALCVISH
jgi:hypothetical protein